MRRTRDWKHALAALGLGVATMGAAPAAPGYYQIERTIARVRGDWAQPGARPQPNAAGWNAFFDALSADLGAYAAAGTEDDRLRALGRLHQRSTALSTVSWGTAAAIHEELRTWMRPRVQLAWSERRLADAIQALPPTADPAALANRQTWVRFLDEDLGDAVGDYEGAPTVRKRRDALRRVYAALTSLQKGNESRPWTPAIALEAALNDLYNRPNIDATVDVAALSPSLSADIVNSGPIFFKGHWSFVTAGPKTGFGLLPSDEGIAFYNSQALTSVTPIDDFQQQLESDRKGRRAANLYYFNATSFDSSELTITSLLTPDGLQLGPSYAHGVDAAIGSTPLAGHGKKAARAVAGLLGQDQGKITEKVYEGAIGKIQQGVVEGAAELGAIRSGEAEADRNAKLRTNLIGNHMLVYRNLLVTGLNLRSRPEFAQIGGTIQYLRAAEQVGADAPEPSVLQGTQPGVSTDIHLPSVMTNLVRGRLQSPEAQDAYNLMFVTHKIPPGTPASEGIALSRNVDYPTFLKAVETAQAANDPKVLAVRVKRPGRSPEFGADTRGNLVALIHDFAVEVPAPPRAAAGGGLSGPPAKVYLLASPEAEFTIAYQIIPAEGHLPIRLSGRVVDFDPGPGARVYAINDDEKKPTQLTAFTSAFVLQVFGAKVKGQPIDVPLSGINLRNYELTSASPLDPSGWLRLILQPKTAAPVAPTPELAPSGPVASR